MNKLVAGMLVVIRLGGIMFTYSYFSSDSESDVNEPAATGAGGGVVSIKINSPDDVGDNNGEENAV